MLVFFLVCPFAAVQQSRVGAEMSLVFGRAWRERVGWAAYRMSIPASLRAIFNAALRTIRSYRSYLQALWKPSIAGTPAFARLGIDVLGWTGAECGLSRLLSPIAIQTAGARLISVSIERRLGAYSPGTNGNPITLSATALSDQRPCNTVDCDFGMVTFPDLAAPCALTHGARARSCVRKCAFIGLDRRWVASADRSATRLSHLKLRSLQAL